MLWTPRSGPAIQGRKKTHRPQRRVDQNADSYAAQDRESRGKTTPEESHRESQDTDADRPSNPFGHSAKV